MERSIIKDLADWKKDAKRKPLILRGVRQCGKTWILKEFGRKYYKNTVYVSFDERPDFKDFFMRSKEPAQIVENLSVALKQPIHPAETLIILDEIQECPEALGSLKYFRENYPDMHIACAGSLLGIRISGGGSFPVGKVDFLSIFPLSFSEFLVAAGDENLLKYLSSIDEISALPEAFFNQLYDRLKLYFVTGGMPESIAEWNDRHDINKLEKTLANILIAYDIDFSKHLSPAMFQKVSRVWRSLPAQLAKENKKFQYNLVKDGANSRDYDEAIAWLNDANLIHRVNRIKSPGLPLSAYEDESAFKLYAADIGLLRRLSSLDSSAFGEKQKLFTEFKGALSENYILQSLLTQYNQMPRYWTTYNPTYEVDFVIQHQNEIIPAEVKAGIDTKGKGLAVYREKYKDKAPLRIRYSLLNLNLTDDLLNIPLFMADHTKQLIGIALANRNPQTVRP